MDRKYRSEIIFRKLLTVFNVKQLIDPIIKYINYFFIILIQEKDELYCPSSLSVFLIFVI